MASDQEKFEREERARRLKQAREAANLSGPKAVVAASEGSINENVYKAHEQGRNGFTVSDGRVYANLFGVSFIWLYLGVGTPGDADLPGASPALKRAFARLIDAPDEIQTQIVNMTNFLTGSPAQPAQPEQDQRRDQSEPANRRRATTPSE
jgi:hypothetical protein